MKYYSGLDVSLKETFISIIDAKGSIVKEGFVPTDIHSISMYLKSVECEYEKIGIEIGKLSISLCKGLIAEGLPITCVDARHMAAALSARINKNDRNDARGIAQMMRAGLYKEVEVKSDEACQVKILLGSRGQLVRSHQQLMGTIRGLLKIENFEEPEFFIENLAKCCDLGIVLAKNVDDKVYCRCLETEMACI